VRVATAAGFFLDADSEVLHSDVDDMTRHIRDEDLRGFTNRFVLRFRKPQ
jgi:predicted methyltransferase